MRRQEEGRVRRFENRVAVVTGAASGIGRATSELLARRGCDLALVDIDADGTAETAERVRSVGRKVSVHSADVSDRIRMETLPEQVTSEHGHVHVLVNNAGVGVTATLEEHTLEDFEWIFGINFWGAVYGCKFFLPYLLREEEAHIVNLSSMVAFMGLPGQSAYCATKSAVRALSESLYAELSGGPIGVTSVHPGMVHTNVVRSSRFSDDEQKHRIAERVDRFSIPPERAARKIVRAIERRKPRVLIGPDAYLMESLERLAPVLSQRALAWAYRRWS
jgi:short-subunit dehydrogenase